jgi:choline dehydrogenase-like flavoprotein
MSLNSSQLETLRLVCDTLLPSIDTADDPHGYWRRRASDLNVAAAVAENIASLPAEKDRRDLEQLIGIFDSPTANLIFCGKPLRFSALTSAAREQYLRDWENSLLPMKRQGFQALKRLASFAYFTATDERGLNPNWPALNYPGPLAVPAGTPVPLTLISHSIFSTQPSALACDVVVVGSGAGGSVIAAELAHAGKSVIVVEKGGGYGEPDFTQREAEMTRKLYWNGGSLVTRDSAFLLLAGSCLGGGTTVNWNTSLRPPKRLRDRWEFEHGLTGVSGAEFDIAVDAVCERMSAGTGETFINEPNDRLQLGAQALGYHADRLPRNVRGCDDGRVCGFCTFGCRSGAKQATPQTFLSDACAHGARIIVDAEVERILVKNGRAAGVQVRIAEAPEPITIRARAVVAAGGSIGSPALLLRSGLTNPHIGRHLTIHPTSVVAGIYDEPVEPWVGPPQSIVCDRFADMGDGYGFVLETAPMHTGLPAVVTPWTSGRDYKADMLQLNNTAAFIALVKDRDCGQVTINQSGQPRVDYRLSAYDRAHLVRGVQEAARVHIAAGAHEVRTLHNRPVRWRLDEHVDAFIDAIARAPYAPNTVMLGSAHQMGTCRMGRDPQSAVADGSGQVFGVPGLWIGDASAFPTASGVNPMITIMSLAYRTAHSMLAML